MLLPSHHLLYFFYSFLLSRYSMVVVGVVLRVLSLDGGYVDATTHRVICDKRKTESEKHTYLNKKKHNKKTTKNENKKY